MSVSLPRNIAAAPDFETLRSQVAEMVAILEDVFAYQVSIYYVSVPNQKLPTLKFGDLVFDFTVQPGVATLQQWDGKKLIPLDIIGDPTYSSSVFFYRADTHATAANDPGSGFVRWNNAVQQSSTALYFDWLTIDGFDPHVLFGLTTPTQKFLLQDPDLAVRYQEWEISGPVINHPDWFQVPVTFVGFGGGGPFAFSHNQKLAAVLLTSSGGAIGPAGPPGPIGPVGPPGIPGADGADGVGVPPAGGTGFILAKNSPTDYDTAWTNPLKLFQAVQYEPVSNGVLPNPELLFDGETGDVMMTFVVA